MKYSCVTQNLWSLLALKAGEKVGKKSSFQHRIICICCWCEAVVLLRRVTCTALVLSAAKEDPSFFPLHLTGVPSLPTNDWMMQIFANYTISFSTASFCLLCFFCSIVGDLSLMKAGGWLCKNLLAQFFFAVLFTRPQLSPWSAKKTLHGPVKYRNKGCENGFMEERERDEALVWFFSNELLDVSLLGHLW